MMGALASHYARSLADAVFRENSGITPEAAVEQLRSVEGIISGSKELERVLLSPAVNKNRRAAVIGKLSDGLGLHRLIKNFLLVVVSHRRTNQLREIRRKFEAVVDDKLGWLPAEISSAKALDAREKEQVEGVLGAKLGKFIRAHYDVDPALLAGVRARVASREYDGTLRGKLEFMRQRLAAPR
jgi:F-type H+-transporting ATPase subunit delta